MRVVDDAFLRNMMDPGSGVITTTVDNGTVRSEVSAVDNNEEEDTTPAVAEVKDARGQATWSTTPSFQDQYRKHPTTCRLLGPTIDSFDITSASAKDDLNKLLAQQQPVDAPSIIVASRDKAFHEGKWIVLLEYYRVEYKKLVTH